VSGAAEIDVWQRLLAPESAPLVAAAAGAVNVASIDRLRRAWPRDLVQAALVLAEARRKAAAKFPEPAKLVADPPGVEQATSHVVAMHKARRFDGTSTAIIDLCCGIGGDAMALARAGAVTAIDVRPLRAFMAERNADCAARCADVETSEIERLVPEGAAFHVDPARRDEGGGRHARLADHRPGPAFLARLLRARPDGAIKLGPGVDIAAVAALFAPDHPWELEIVSERGALVQAIAWCGRLALHPGERTATRLPEGRSLTARPRPLPAPSGGSALDRYLVLVDPAAERAGLSGAAIEGLPVREVHPGLGILTSGERVTGPWIEAHEVLAEMPWRVENVRGWLAHRGAGVVTVRTRGGAADTDAAQHRLRGDGSTPYTVFVLRLGRSVRAVVVGTAREPE
jgi:hypothetical protein